MSASMQHHLCLGAACRVFIFCACANVESINWTINELSYAFNFNFQLVDFHAPVSARQIIPCVRAWRLTAVQCKAQYRSESLYNPFLREQALVKGIRTLGSRLDEGARQSLKMRYRCIYRNRLKMRNIDEYFSGCQSTGSHYNPFNMTHGGPLDKKR